MTRKYIINCNENTSFKGWTHQEPQTRKEIIDDFYNMAYIEDSLTEVKKKDYTLNFICDIWNLTIYYLNNKGIAINLYDNKDKLYYNDKFKMYLDKEVLK